MARRSTGHEVLQKAQGDVASAATADQLRAALAVTLPLVLGLSLAQTAEVIGKTPAWVGRTRMRYIRGPRKEKLPEKRGGRRNNLLTIEEEKICVEKAVSNYTYGPSPVGRLGRIVSRQLGYPLSRSAIHKMFLRNSGRELMEVKRLADRERGDREHAKLMAKWAAEKERIKHTV